MMTFAGMKIMVDHTGIATRPPSMMLAPQGIGPGMVYVSDAVRNMMDTWMLERFGRKHVVLKVDGMLVMHPDDIAKLRLANGIEPYPAPNSGVSGQNHAWGARP
ncbi:hypothetical protein [Duganella sp. BJB475]|uniref:hypothetical protein n=1 Tax=Duganella sp. BJB475 TaxID=2233914 RepID=UPI000EC47D9C|nr:hypothetical protein [Duganella sp. BJB475]RFP19163.1 hypothetical protein D0T23_05115 [Duganella sp. BJB475]